MTDDSFNRCQMEAIFVDADGYASYGDLRALHSEKQSGNVYRITLTKPTEELPIVFITPNTRNKDDPGFVAAASVQNVTQRSFDVYFSDLGGDARRISSAFSCLVIRTSSWGQDPES